MGKTDKPKSINLLPINKLFASEIGKFMHKVNSFLHMLKLNHSVHPISTINNDDFHNKFLSKIITQQSVEFSGVTEWNNLFL